jgi:hypothetical protein
VDSVGLTQHVTNSGGGAWTDDQRWRARVTMELGVEDGPGPEVFGTIGAFAVDSAGNLYVLDEQASEVRVFDRDGLHVRSIGGPGQGPGELARPSGLNIDPSGNLWVWETSGRRFSIFDPSGQYLRSVPRLVSGVLFPWRGEFDTGGSMIDWGLDYPELTAGGMDVMPRLAIFYPVRVSDDTGALDTLPELRYESARTPFKRGLSTYVALDDAIWFALTDEYKVYRRSLAGDTTMVITLDGVPPEPVTAAERDSIVRLYAQRPAGATEFPLDEMPDVKPVITRLFDDRAGHLLVVPQVAGHEPGTLIDVFEMETGMYLGRVELPVSIETNPAPIATSGSIYAMTRGDFDVPLVVRIDLSEGE